MKVQDLNKAKIPLIKIDPKLEEFKGRILLPKKLDLANKLLDNAQLPNNESQHKISSKKET